MGDSSIGSFKLWNQYYAVFWNTSGGGYQLFTDNYRITNYFVKNFLLKIISTTVFNFYNDIK